MLITSKLDYCNGLLYGLPSQQVNRLQSILNTAALLVTMTRKYDHITPILRDLHWLPVNFRVQFKLLLQAYKALHGLIPSYLSSKLSLRPNKGLRSDNQLLLDVPKSTLQLKYYGDRAFSVAGPILWNALPKQILSTVLRVILKLISSRKLLLDFWTSSPAWDAIQLLIIFFMNSACVF